MLVDQFQQLLVHVLAVDAFETEDGLCGGDTLFIRRSLSDMLR